MTDSKRIDVAELARKIAEQLMLHAKELEKQQAQQPRTDSNRQQWH